MIFAKPNYFEILMANFKNDEFRNEVLVATIDDNYNLTQHAPVDLFLHNRKYVIINGYKNSEWVRRDLMSIGKTQEYAGWTPILSIEDFEKTINSFINREKAKKQLFESDSKKHSFYQDYAL